MKTAIQSFHSLLATGRSLLLLLAILALPSSAFAQLKPAPLGAEFRVNTETIGKQTNPVVASGLSNNFIVAWGTIDSSVLSAQRYDSTGAPVGVQTVLDATSSGSIGMDQAGNSLLISQDTDGDGYGVFATPYDSSGTALAPKFQVNTFTTSFQGSFNTYCNATGDCVVVWRSTGVDGDGSGIAGRRYDVGGTAAGGEFVVNNLTTGSQREPAVAVAADGSFVVSWSSTAGNPALRMRRFDAAGMALGTEFAVSSYTSSQGRSPRLAVSPVDDSLTVVWTEDGDRDGDGWGMFGRRFDAAGTPLATDFQINTYTTGDQLISSVAADPSGGFLVSWWTTNDVLTEGNVGARYYDASGTPQASEFEANSVIKKRQEPWSQSIGIAANGDALVVWETNADAHEQEIHAQRFGLTTPPPCAPVPDLACIDAELGRSKISIIGKGGKKNKLKWSFRGDTPSDIAAYLDPADGNPLMQLCVYDSSGAVQPISAMYLPYGGNCTFVEPARKCWRTLGTKGYKYGNKGAPYQGINAASMKLTGSAQPQLKLKAAGTRLPAPTLPLTLPVTVQFVSDDSISRSCWQAEFTEASRNEAEKFKAKGP